MKTVVSLSIFFSGCFPFKSWQTKSNFLFSIGARFERNPERIDQQLVLERFAQEGYRAHRQRTLAHSDLIVGRDKDDGKATATPGHSLLHLEPVKARHLYVKDDTVRIKRRRRFDEIDEVLTGSKSFCVHSERTHQPFNSPTHRFVVVDNRDKWSVFARDAPLPRNALGTRA